MPAWSYSSLSNYVTCPAQYYAMRVQKRYAQEDSEHSIWGKDVHKALELRVGVREPLPSKMIKFEALAAKLDALDCDKYLEQELAVDISLQPIAFSSPNAWARGIADFIGIKKRKALTIDYKTGKRKLGSRQLLMMACLIFANFPDVDEVIAAYLWLQDGKPDVEVYHRSQIAELWSKFDDDLRNLNWSFEHNAWPATPSGLCKNYCAVLDCVYNGRSKL